MIVKGYSIPKQTIPPAMAEVRRYGGAERIRHLFRTRQALGREYHCNQRSGFHCSNESLSWGREHVSVPAGQGPGVFPLGDVREPHLGGQLARTDDIHALMVLLTHPFIKRSGRQLEKSEIPGPA